MVSFRIENDGRVAGRDVPQIYVSPVAGGWEAPKRLAGFRSVELAPDADTMVTLDPRSAAARDLRQRGARVAHRRGRVSGDARRDRSRDIEETVTVTLPERRLPVGWRPAVTAAR